MVIKNTFTSGCQCLINKPNEWICSVTVGNGCILPSQPALQRTFLLILFHFIQLKTAIFLLLLLPFAANYCDLQKHICTQRNILPGSQWAPWLNIISVAQLSVCIWARGEMDKNNQTFVLPSDFWNAGRSMGQENHLMDLWRHQTQQPSDGDNGRGRI